MKNLCKILISFLMFSTSLNSFAAGTQPTAPTCEREIASTDQNGNPTRVQNGACIREWNNYNTSMKMWSDNDIKGSDRNYAGPQEPVKPVSSNCNNADHTCLVKDQTAMAVYAKEKHVYDLGQQMIVQQTAAASATEAERNKRILEASKSSSGGFSEVADENKAGSAVYQAAAMAAATYGGVKIAEAAECGTPACAAALTALAMAAFAQMGKAKAQAKRMNNAQYSACNSANQTGAVTTDCGAAPTADDKNPYDPKNVDGIADLDKDGKCKPNSPACEAMVKDPRFKGTDFKAVGGGLSAFASDKNKNKIGKDGTMTLPNGQTTNVDALMSKEGMMKAGMTAAQADALMKQMQGSGAPVASLDSKKELDDLNKADAAVAAEMGALSSGAAGAGTGQNLNGNGMGSKDISKRKPSSEGLTREFHGDTIGAAGDDIFSMMNRRYKLKAEQDTFMGPR